MRESVVAPALQPSCLSFAPLVMGDSLRKYSGREAASSPRPRPSVPQPFPMHPFSLFHFPPLTSPLSLTMFRWPMSPNTASHTFVREAKEGKQAAMAAEGLFQPRQ